VNPKLAFFQAQESHAAARTTPLYHNCRRDDLSSSYGPPESPAMGGHDDPLGKNAGDGRPEIIVVYGFLSLSSFAIGFLIGLLF
jgi:hypothetical protein